MALVIGVDTVGISYPADSFDERGCTATVRNYGTDEEGYLFQRKLPGGGFMAAGIGGRVWLEASLPKRADRWDVLDPAQLPDALEHLWTEALDYFEPARPSVDGITVPSTWRLARIVRLDVARDFSGITAFPALCNGLAAVPRGKRGKVRRFKDPSSNHAETLRVGPAKTWSCTLYDKHAETKGLAPEGTVRYEARLRKPFLQSKAAETALGTRLRFAGDVTPYVVERLGRERWAHVGFGADVSGLAAFVEKVNQTDLSPREKRDLIAYLIGIAAGIDLQWSRNTEGKYRRLARQLGITLSRSELEAQLRVALDLDQGGQVIDGF